MSQQELLRKVLSGLNEFDFPYMLTGSIVSSIQGEPRLSHDIDIVISGERRIIDILKAYFDEKDYYFDADSIQDAIASQGMFNLIETASGDKIDFWMLTDSIFDESRFTRKTQVSLFNIPAWVSTVEDTILAKMFWAKKSGGSAKQLADVERVYEINKDSLDYRYLEKWCFTLGVMNFWDEVSSGKRHA